MTDKARRATVGQSPLSEATVKALIKNNIIIYYNGTKSGR